MQTWVIYCALVPSLPGCAVTAFNEISAINTWIAEHTALAAFYSDDLFEQVLCSLGVNKPTQILQ